MRTIPPRADVVIIGAGVVGAATAYFAAASGLDVVVVERGTIAAGTSSRCEGNILVSDKEVGPELELSLYSQRVWREDLAEFAGLWEFEAKGGVVVASGSAGLAGLRTLAQHQAGLGIRVEVIDSIAGVAELEPSINRDLAGGAYYPDDAQVQPLLATHHLLRLARGHGATVLTGTEVTGILVERDQVTGVETAAGRMSAPAVVNCAGAWSGEIAALANVHLPVLPRRGFVLVTEPVPITVHHKVYAAEYVGDVASSDAGLQVSPVVEGTPSGTILMGASRERVGFDASFSAEAVARIAASGLQLFPVLRGVRAQRAYSGFRPYCPDHLPSIGADARLPGLWHAAGHEGAGVGLSVGTGKLLAQGLTGRTPDLDLTPFRPERLAEVAAA
ncbi:NAD(P)/FAD-dependent oxidoreductase [Microbacterium gorillae]|uniref:NAD(P)/FAD-dependent oxidoreductase n=1 Tax=Microbacterium gorillae TaxID=1231063 RepID=UPI0005903E94|nr:FAD-dependent oxidoreductase [Microbacterium gorillae]